MLLLVFPIPFSNSWNLKIDLYERPYSLKVKSGEYIGIVRGSGEGKTPLCNLIHRFYDVTSGSIWIDSFEI